MHLMYSCKSSDCTGVPTCISELKPLLFLKYSIKSWGIATSHWVTFVLSCREMRVLLERCAATALSSKLVAAHKDFFAKMVVDAVMLLDDLLPLSMIGMKKVKGGALQDSRLIAGVAFKKTFSYAGFEMQPKKYKNPKIALLNVELELKAEKENAEIRLDNVEVTDAANLFYICR